jgi:hypothetical protein
MLWKCSTSLGWEIEWPSMILIPTPSPSSVILPSSWVPGTSIASVMSRATTTVGARAEPLAAAPLKPTSSCEVATAWIVASWLPRALRASIMTKIPMRSSIALPR